MVQGACYVHLKKWLQIVPRDRFYFLMLEDLVRDIKSVMRDILDFLELRSSGASLLDDMLQYIKILSLRLTMLKILGYI